MRQLAVVISRDKIWLVVAKPQSTLSDILHVMLYSSMNNLMY